jgi:hypothetical protein
MLDHPHPRNFRLARHFDRGWGEIAFKYRWDSDSGLKSDAGCDELDLGHCFLYEVTTYAGNAGSYREGWVLSTRPSL